MEAAPSKGRGPTIEIAGVSGSGKSTLAHLICAGREDCRLDERLQLRKLGHLPYAAHSLPHLVPLLVAAARARRRPDWAELKLLVYLMEWTRSFRHQPDDRTVATFLDQGPMYALARLGVTSPPLAATEPNGPWWTSRVVQWAASLDVIVWLDAPDQVLLKRMHERSQGHAMRDQPEDVGLAFIDRYRASFATVINAAVDLGGTEVCRYDTSVWSADQIASDVLQRLAHQGTSLDRGSGE
jgi:hypothetical protein